MGIVKITRTKRFYKPVILCYHRISEKKFASHISLINQEFNIQPLQILLDNVYGEDNEQQSKDIAITMDDCYSKEFHNVLVVLSRLQIPCTFFIPTGYVKNKVSMWALRFMNFLDKVGNTFIGFEGEEVTLVNKSEKKKYQDTNINRLSFSDIQTIKIEEKISQLYKNNNLIDDTDKIIEEETIKQCSQNSQLSFQPHTETHPKLYLCDDEEVIEEMEMSKKYLFSITAKVQNIFCYPYGSTKIIGNSYKIAKNYFKYAVTLVSGVVTKSTNPMYIPRIGIYEHDTHETIQLKITIAQMKGIFNKK